MKNSTPAARAASSACCVPSTWTRQRRRPALLSGTSAAWWCTTSTPAIASATRAASRMSARRYSMPAGSSSAGRMSSTRTRSPRAWSARAVWAPRNPAPPVTRWVAIAARLGVRPGSHGERGERAGERERQAQRRPTRRAWRHAAGGRSEHAARSPRIVRRSRHDYPDGLLDGLPLLQAPADRAPHAFLELDPRIVAQLVLGARDRAGDRLAHLREHVDLLLVAPHRLEERVGDARHLARQRR